MVPPPPGRSRPPGADHRSPRGRDPPARPGPAAPSPPGPPHPPLPGVRPARPGLDPTPAAGPSSSAAAGTQRAAPARPAAPPAAPSSHGPAEPASSRRNPTHCRRKQALTDGLRGQWEGASRGGAGLPPREGGAPRRPESRFGWPSSGRGSRRAFPGRGGAAGHCGAVENPAAMVRPCGAARPRRPFWLRRPGPLPL